MGCLAWGCLPRGVSAKGEGCLPRAGVCLGRVSGQGLSALLHAGIHAYPL